MNTTKSLAEQVNEVMKSRISPYRKREALIKLGVTPYEAMQLANVWMPVASPKKPRVKKFSFTFGVEIETVNCPRSIFYARAQQNGLEVHTSMTYNHNDMKVFKLVSDGSLVGDNCAECVTPPLKGERSGYEALKACCKALAETGATVNKTCGLHVHIGAKDLTEYEYVSVFINYQMLETAIDSFMAASRRGNNCRWCRTLSDHTLYNCATRLHVLSELDSDRYHKVNPCAWQRHKTIEFRQHQGTTSYEKIQNWVNFLGKLVEFSKNTRLTEKITRIEDIPFLTEAEKEYFTRRRYSLA